MNKIQENLLKSLGLELEQEFEFEYCNRKATYKFCIDENNEFALKIKGLNCWIETNNRALMIINHLEGIAPIKKPILDKQEKKYLEGVFRPFKNDIDFVKLDSMSWEPTFVYIRAKTIFHQDHFTLPIFEKGTMYKGMEINKKYTLKELGLFEE